EFFDSLDKNLNSWNIVGVPSPEWAKKVFPNLNENDSIDALWNAIFKAVRIDTPNPILAWEEHKNSFAKKIALLNEYQFEKLHYKNSVGTDITIGLTKNHIWAGGGAELQNGNYYFPNMPTEEIFCSPNRNIADGTVVSSMPLNHRGSLVDDFSITFKDGRVTDFSAKVGFDVLKEIIELDEGSHHLGEIALIPVNSPISQMGILFYNTLFDENASCHFALGKGFPECIENGFSMTDTEILENIALFENGNWLI
ncbi:MAG: aminopeptidase, partial [Oscillospiraceae bacterium]